MLDFSTTLNIKKLTKHILRPVNNIIFTNINTVIRISVTTKRLPQTFILHIFIHFTTRFFFIYIVFYCEHWISGCVLIPLSISETEHFQANATGPLLMTPNSPVGWMTTAENNTDG